MLQCYHDLAFSSLLHNLTSGFLKILLANYMYLPCRAGVAKFCSAGCEVHKKKNMVCYNYWSIRSSYNFIHLSVYVIIIYTYVAVEAITYIKIYVWLLVRGEDRGSLLFNDTRP